MDFLKNLNKSIFGNSSNSYSNGNSNTLTVPNAGLSSLSGLKQIGSPTPTPPISQQKTLSQVSSGSGTKPVGSTLTIPNQGLSSLSGLSSSTPNNSGASSSWTPVSPQISNSYTSPTPQVPYTPAFSNTSGYSYSQPTNSTSPTGQNLGDYNTNLANLYKASAPLNQAQFQPYLDQVSQANQQYALANTDRQNSDMNARKLLQGNSVTQDFFNNSQNERNRIYNYNLLGAGNAQTAANQTLQTQLALAQALRTGSVEQATVPFDVNKPVSVAPGTSLVNPYTGAVQGGYGSTASGGSGNTFISDLASQVVNGNKTFSDAASQVSQLGLAGQQQLNQAIQSINPNFNYNASNASKQTTATGQQVSTAAQSAYAALDKLQTDFDNLGGLQTGGIPLTNNFAQGIGNAFGSGNTGAYQTTLHDARAQLQGVLTASGAVTPTGAAEMAQAYLPDGMTGDQLKSKIEAAKALIQQKVNAFTSSGAQNGSQNTGGGVTVTTKGGISF